MNLRELTEQEFKLFTEKYTISSMYQTVEYAKILDNKKIIYLGMFSGKKMYAATFIYINKQKGLNYAYAPKGFLIDYSNFDLVTTFTKLINDYLKKKKIVSIRLNPIIIKNIYDYSIDKTINNDNFDNIFKHLTSLKYKHKGFHNYFEDMLPRFEAYIDINIEANKIFDQMNKSLKTKLRSADTQGIRIHKGNILDLDELYVMSQYKYKKKIDYFKDLMSSFNENAEIYYAKLNTNLYLRYIQLKYQKQIQICAKYNEQVFKNAGKDRNNSAINKKIDAEKILTKIKKELVHATNLLQNNPNGILLASCLIIKNKEEIYLCMDGYDTKYKKFNAKHLLIWKIIENYSNNKFNRFNLGGMSNNNMKNNKYIGLNNFKASFGSKQVEYIGDFELIINKPLHLIGKILNIFNSKKK